MCPDEYNIIYFYVTNVLYLEKYPSSNRFSLSLWFPSIFSWITGAVMWTLTFLNIVIKAGIVFRSQLQLQTLVLTQ